MRDQSSISVPRPGPDFLYALQERLVLRALADGGPRFLDIGCGRGRLMATALSATSDVHGIDLDEARVEECRGLMPLADVRVASADTLPFDDRSMDAVTIFSTLCVVPDAAKAIGELSRVLRPGGIAVLHFHGRHNPNVRFWSEYYRSRGDPYNSHSASEARSVLDLSGLQETDFYALGLTDARKYLPIVKHLSGMDRLFHAGSEPDLDYRLSNLPVLLRMASHFVFVVRRRQP